MTWNDVTRTLANQRGGRLQTNSADLEYLAVRPTPAIVASLQPSSHSASYITRAYTAAPMALVNLFGGHLGSFAVAYDTTLRYRAFAFNL